MRKKSILILLLVGMVGLFIPKEVFAARPDSEYYAYVDYRFFVEDQDEKEVGDLKFKLHDVNNIISYDSQFDPNTGAYYFIDYGENSNGYYNPQSISSDIIPSYLLDELDGLSFTDFYYRTEALQ